MAKKNTKTFKTIIVFGANGRVGSIVVRRLVKHGYKVKAFVHHANGLKSSGLVEYIEGDVTKKRDVENALKDADAVISTLGSWGTKSKNILSSGMKQIVPVMEKYSIRRIISLTGADAWAPETRHEASLLQKLSHKLFSTIASKIVQDGEKHIAILEKSTLDWTVIRSLVMNDSGNKKYVLGLKYPAPWRTINRTAVAKALVDQLEDKTFLKQAPYIHR
ncbi:MAG: NAD(P)-binding oxidoreductase [Candidatus Microsaccharimonas sp.]